MSRIYQIQDFRPANEALSDAPTTPAEMFSDILASCPRIHAMKQSEQATQLARLIDAGAWTDAALALIALELPRWQLRRLAYDSGEWHCALSSSRDMPEWLDASVETHHADMALAILAAFNEARRGPPPTHLSVVAVADTNFEPLCCDNFA
jgi:hypothetical protein